MPALGARTLFQKLSAALPKKTEIKSGPEEHRPAELAVPNVGRVRAYLWTVTEDRSVSGRPPGEYKIQLILPGQEKGAEGKLDSGGKTLVVLLGYSAEFGVFVGWDAAFYGHFAYSRNVQVRVELLEEARMNGWAVAEPRRLQRAEDKEVRLAFTPGNLPLFLRLYKQAVDEGLGADEREFLFLSKTPNVPKLDELEEDPPAKAIKKARSRIETTRLARSRDFGKLIRVEYRHACALCGIQLEIVEGAHIVPAAEEGSEDEAWNGVAMCPNHHRLYDASLFVIAPETQEVVVDEEAVEFLREVGKAGGIDFLLRHGGLEIRRPASWKKSDFRKRMRGALQTRASHLSWRP